MKADPFSIAEIFTNRVRYCVPMFQRHYVWEEQKQWEPLWEDVVAKTQARIEKHEKRYPHYMGAIVLDSKDTYSTKKVSVCNVIDGQQRLTTLQIFLAALRDAAQAKGFEGIAEDSKQYLCNINPHLMEEPDTEIYKVWPTKFDRDVFSNLINLGSRQEVQSKFSQYYRHSKNRLKVIGYVPRLLSAYMYFYDQITGFITPDEDDLEPLSVIAPEERLEILYRAFLEDFRLVEIRLEAEDDPQVIFETLNDRGTPLLASDLIRNYIFFRAEQRKEDADKLYEKHWNHFEDEFWSEKETQGRLKRARLEFFMAHFLTSKTGHEINLTRLFQEYKAFITKQAGYENIGAELEDIKGYAPIYRQLVMPHGNDATAKFARALSVWDVTTIFPAAFAILHSDVPVEEKQLILQDLLSYVVRRAVCGKTPKYYNKLFLALVRHLHKADVSQKSVRDFFTAQKGDSSYWPSDDEFCAAWLNSPIYSQLPPSRIRYMLEELEKRSLTSKTEDVEIRSVLSVEHVMPQTWHEHWPLVNGINVTSQMALEASLNQFNEGSATNDNINKRNTLLQTMGNLTLLTQPLNSSVKNGAFTSKRPAIIEQSALALNRYFHNVSEWDEDSIIKRGQSLFEYAKKIWPHPATT